MPRIESLYPTYQPSTSLSGNRHRRIDRNSYLHPPAKPRSRSILRFSHRPRTLSNKSHKAPKPFIFGQRSQASHRRSASSWKSRLSFHSRSTQQAPQPLTLEEKLCVAADRIRRFERPTRPQTRSHIKPQAGRQTRTKSKTQTRIHREPLSKSRAPVRKRDRLQDRLSTFVSGNF